MWRIRRIFSKLGQLFARRRAERELAREIETHLALAAEDFERQGMSPDEARLAARRAYGGVEQAKQLHRDERSFIGLEQAMQDIRHAARSIRKSPGFAAVAVLSLAAGIGITTAVFTLVHGVLLKTLPVPEPERVVQLRAKLKRWSSPGFSYPAFREIQRQSAPIFEDIAGFSPRPAILETAGEPQRLEIEMVTGSYFSFFNARPALGRLLDAEDDRVERAHPVCVVSHGLWQRVFGGDPSIIGRTIRVDGIPLSVAGVVSREFTGPELQRRLDLWIPTSLAADFARNPRETPNWTWLQIMARLSRGVPFSQAAARLEAASKSIEDALPRNRSNKNAVYQIRDASKGFDTVQTMLRRPLTILMGAVTLLVLLACANLANLLLARANERRHEFGMKVALGISQWRLVRQLLIESLLLAAMGGVAGWGLSIAFTRFLLIYFNAGNRWQTVWIAPDRTVLLFTFAVCVATAVAASIYPAWQAWRTYAIPGVGESCANRRNFARRGLIVAEVAIALILVFGASLFAHSLRKLKTIDLGFDIDRVLTADLEVRGTRTRELPVAAPQIATVLARVRQLPGIESAALSEPGTMAGSSMTSDGVKTFDSKGHEHETDLRFLFVTPGYLGTLRIPLLRGRDFTSADRKGSAAVAIVNQRAAQSMWPGDDPIGKRLPAGWNLKDLEVIGVAANGKYTDLREKPVAAVYQAYDQMPASSGTLTMRCRGGFEQVARDVYHIVRTSAPGYQVSNMAAMEVTRDGQIAQERLLAFLSSVFGVVATLLALVGIYGIVAYSVTRRTREIGIRMSVGAPRRSVLWLFLRESVILLSIAVAIGLPAALVLARFAEKMLYEVSTRDPLGIGAALVTITLCTVAAAFLPARRATRIDPMQALRYD